MAGWDLGAPHDPPILSRDQAIEIALSDPMTSPELRNLPVDAEYGSRGGRPDVWKVAVDVSSLGWDTGYEGPGPTRINGESYRPHHVRVPKVRAVIILVDDKMRRRAISGREPEPNQERRIEWLKAGQADNTS